MYIYTYRPGGRERDRDREKERRPFKSENIMARLSGQQDVKGTHVRLFSRGAYPMYPSIST